MTKPAFFTDDDKRKRVIPGQNGQQPITAYISGKKQNDARTKLLRKKRKKAMQRQSMDLGQGTSKMVTHAHKFDEPKIMDQSLRKDVESYRYHEERSKYLPDPDRNRQKSQEELGNKTGIFIPDGILKYIRAIGMAYALHDFKKVVEASTFDDPSPMNKFLHERYAWQWGYKDEKILKKLLPEQKQAIIDVINQKVNDIAIQDNLAEKRKAAHQEVMDRFRAGKINHDHPDFAEAINDSSIDDVEAAKFLRKELREKFPGVEFSVRTKGNSIRVDYVDGPTQDKINTITRKYTERMDLPEIDLFMGNRYAFVTRGHTKDAGQKARAIFKDRFGRDPDRKKYEDDQWLYKILNETELAPRYLKEESYGYLD